LTVSVLPEWLSCGIIGPKYCAGRGETLAGKGIILQGLIYLSRKGQYVRRKGHITAGLKIL